jgi:putative oligomerization/nucleic acid binding protein
MPGLLRGMARTAVVAGTATAVSGRVARRQEQRWAQQDAPPPQPQQYAAPAAPAPVAAAGGEDRVQQLKDLAALKEQGVLTDQEFASEKARILGG